MSSNTRTTVTGALDGREATLIGDIPLPVENQTVRQLPDDYGRHEAAASGCKDEVPDSPRGSGAVRGARGRSEAEGNVGFDADVLLVQD